MNDIVTDDELAQALQSPTVMAAYYSELPLANRFAAGLWVFDARPYGRGWSRVVGDREVADAAGFRDELTKFLIGEIPYCPDPSLVRKVLSVKSYEAIVKHLKSDRRMASQADARGRRVA